MRYPPPAASVGRNLPTLWLTALLAAVTLAGCRGPESGLPDTAWRQDFTVDKANLLSTGQNTYFPLQPGHRLRYRHEQETLVITVLDETKVVDGVTTRIVEEREEKDGQLVEVSRNYFACDKTTQDVYYFGEDVDIYKDGKVVRHEGAWLSGVNGAKFGLMMPGQPKVGDRFYQEVAPGVALDRCEIVSTDAKLTTPAATFERCVQTKETSALESGAGRKAYAPGVGLIQDDDLELVEVQPAQK